MLKDYRNIVNMVLLAASMLPSPALSAMPSTALGGVLSTRSPALSGSELPASIEFDWLDGIGEESDESDADRLIAQAMRYGAMTTVPYVWGGNAIGNEQECLACRACIGSKKKLRVERRLKACSACRACGIDCSHFVNRIYRDAGLSFPYASTRELARSSPQALKSRYGLIDIGARLAEARPGDLLLHPKHVVLLLKLRGGDRADVLHVSRSIEANGKVGGVEVLHNVDVRRFRGRLIKILRHERLHELTPPRRGVPPERGIPPEMA